MEKSNILNEVLICLNEVKVEISSITFDGAPSNISTDVKLEASFDPSNFEPKSIVFFPCNYDCTREFRKTKTNITFL